MIQAYSSVATKLYSEKKHETEMRQGYIHFSEFGVQGDEHRP